MHTPDNAMPATPAQQALIAGYAARLEGAAHGERGALTDALARELNVDVRTARRWMQPHRAQDRRRRADAGTLALTPDEAKIVSAALMESTRANGKRIGKLSHLVEQLRTARMIRAERVDGATGEIIALSDTSVARALRAYRLHPDQLRQPTPHVNLASPHPNYLWQVDASVCVLFYLPGGGAGLYELRDGVHYKNKPENLKAIEAFRVIRYVVYDHCSGALRWRYYPHAESGQHTVRFLAWAMAPKEGNTDPFHGAPLHLMVDPGATAAGLVKRFCHRMDIGLIVNKPGNARAKGGVEKGQDIIECAFEHGLKYEKSRLKNFDDLNRLAEMYQLHFNATKKHSRHGMTRFAKWLEIRPDELRITPPENVLLSLATEEPDRRRVNGDITVQFRGRTWSVADVPGVTRDAWVAVHWHPFIRDTAMAVTTDINGREVHIPLTEITKNEHGFLSSAVTVGTGYKAVADTALETNRKEIVRIASGEEQTGVAQAVRKGPGYEPFQGRFDPYKAAREATPPTYLPRAGTALEVEAPQVEARKLSVTAAALRLRARMGDAWTPEHFDFLSRRHADGIGEDQIERLVAQWTHTETGHAQSA